MAQRAEPKRAEHRSYSAALDIALLLVFKHMRSEAGVRVVCFAARFGAWEEVFRSNGVANIHGGISWSGGGGGGGGASLRPNNLEASKKPAHELGRSAEPVPGASDIEPRIAGLRPRSSDRDL